ncbi:class I SAM-dependent methyltransferase [Arcanobacterium phocae]|uniref:class I SAM-dependent methyltransferase n=1 Tax=Arcanobacterium phocae TaxID=131112 RepID=UPI001C0EF620|nr:class I SAM-dependent methyltransferase [Arcanobacterium phocae]
MDAQGWEEKYASTTQLWRTEPNQFVISHSASWPAGTAVDIGCGEGHDVVWLAKHGWTVHGIDFSATAIDRLRQAAQHAGVTDRVSGFVGEAAEIFAREGWADLDLVLLSFLHFEQLPQLIETVAQGVVPGGRIMVATHAFALPWHPASFVAWTGADLIDRVHLPDFGVESSTRLETELTDRNVTRVDDVVVFRRHMAQ